MKKSSPFFSRRVLLGGCILVALVILIGLTWYLLGPVPEPHYRTGPEDFEIIAHRGAHPYYYGDVDYLTGCTATLIRETTPPYIENTIPAVGAAFEYGATMVEIDIRRTADNHAIVFHNGMLECRTDGVGSVYEHTLEEIKGLDAGYGYTADGGETFPFRGEGVGLISTLAEMLDTFPDGRFLLDQKDGTRETTQALVEVLRSYPPERREKLYYWGFDNEYEYLQRQVPEVRKLVSTRVEMERCGRAMVRRLGIGALPELCRARGLIIPANYIRPWYVRWIIGWPDRFLRKASEAESWVVIFVDGTEEAFEIRAAGVRGIMTDRIEYLAPALQANQVQDIIELRHAKDDNTGI